MENKLDYLVNFCMIHLRPKGFYGPYYRKDADGSTWVELDLDAGDALLVASVLRANGFSCENNAYVLPNGRYEIKVTN